MDFNIFNLVAIFSLLLTICTATPLSSRTCIMPTVTTGGNKLIGYVQATATPGLTNYFPRQEFSDHHMIGGTAYHRSVVDRSLAEWACQYSCGENCFAFFVFWDTTGGAKPHFECRVFTAPFAKSDLVVSPKKEWSKGQAFNKQCFGPAMKFKRVDPSSVVLSTGGTSGAVTLTTSTGPYPTSTSTSTIPVTTTITVTVSSVPTSLTPFTATPTSVATSNTSTTRIHSSSSLSSSSSSHVSTSRTTLTTSTTWTTSFTTSSSTCSEVVPSPTATIVNLAVDPIFDEDNLISKTVMNSSNIAASAQQCYDSCKNQKNPQCAAWLIIRGTAPNGTTTWTCHLYKKKVGAGNFVPGPPSEQFGAEFNQTCPATSTAA